MQRKPLYSLYRACSHGGAGFAGQRIARLFEGDMKGGVSQKFEFTPDKISDGMFIYRMQTTSGSYYGKAIMLK